jgi:hypothetical protein
MAKLIHGPGQGKPKGLGKGPVRPPPELILLLLSASKLLIPRPDPRIPRIVLKHIVGLYPTDYGTHLRKRSRPPPTANGRIELIHVAPTLRAPMVPIVPQPELGLAGRTIQKITQNPILKGVDRLISGHCQDALTRTRAFSESPARLTDKPTHSRCIDFTS